MSRAQVFGRRLAVTAALLLVAVGMLRLLWYPGAYFDLSGIGKLVWITAGIMLVVGPVLTAAVYRAGKRGMRFDIVALLLLEMVALAAAMFVMYQRRPAYTVFALDRFEVIEQAEVDTGKIADPRLKRRPGHTPRLVYAPMPATQDELQRLMEETVLLGLPDIERRPERWQHYAAGIPRIRERARPLQELQQGGGVRSREVADWLAAQSRDTADYRYLPLRARAGDAALLLHADILYPVAILQVDPW